MFATPRTRPNTAGPIRRAVVLAAVFLAAVALSGCCGMPRRWKMTYDEPMTYEGKTRIALRDLERILDAKQEWARDTGAGVGSLAPSVEVLAHRYFRKYEYGRREWNDDDTRNLPVTVPKCPFGGEYIVGAVGERPKSSAAGDLLRDYDGKFREIRHTH